MYNYIRQNIGKNNCCLQNGITFYLYAIFPEDVFISVFSLATLHLLCLLNEPCRSLRTLLKNLMVYGSDSKEPLPRGDVAGGFQSAALSSQTGPVVWASCLPQLLVRLSHPDPAVRQCLVELLHLLIKTTSEMAKTSDSGRALATRLVFPAIVGSKGADTSEFKMFLMFHRVL